MRAHVGFEIELVKRGVKHVQRFRTAHPAPCPSACHQEAGLDLGAGGGEVPQANLQTPGLEQHALLD